MGRKANGFCGTNDDITETACDEKNNIGWFHLGDGVSMADPTYDFYGLGADVHDSVAGSWI